MSKILFLRGQVPKDRDPKQIMFNNIDECDDMWTQLCRVMIKLVGGSGELWYRGGKREVQYSHNFVERWLPDFKKNHNDFDPDIVFARGGFPFYDDVLKRLPKAFKIYYGAGFRRTPGKQQFRDFDLILVDTPGQMASAQNKLPSHNIQLLTKPAAENIFYPRVVPAKMYDVILVGNYNKGVDKGHDFALSRIAKDLTVLSIGKVPTKVRNKYPGVTYKGWLPRKEIPKYYALSKVAIVCVGKEDSCPRVIPEALACDCPILVLDRVNFWKEKYLNKLTGEITNRKDFVKDLMCMFDKWKDYHPYDYYSRNISLTMSAREIISYAL